MAACRLATTIIIAHAQPFWTVGSTDMARTGSHSTTIFSCRMVATVPTDQAPVEVAANEGHRSIIRLPAAPTPGTMTLSKLEDLFSHRLDNVGLGEGLTKPQIWAFDLEAEVNNTHQLLQIVHLRTCLMCTKVTSSTREKIHGRPALPLAADTCLISFAKYQNVKSVPLAHFSSRIRCHSRGLVHCFRATNSFNNLSKGNNAASSHVGWYVHDGYMIRGSYTQCTFSQSWECHISKRRVMSLLVVRSVVQSPATFLSEFAFRRQDLFDVAPGKHVEDPSNTVFAIE